jgi:hypothetical protein
MPLTQLTAEFAAAGFVIERLIEPAPHPAMEHSHPETFEKLSHEPAFILFKLARSSAADRRNSREVRDSR